MTLVEIMIVVVVMAIIAVLAAPMMGETDATRVAAAARLLMADLDYARMESVSHPDDLRAVKFDSTNESYSIVRSSSGPPFNCDSVTTVTNAIGNESYIVRFGSGRASELGGVGIDGYSLDGDACLAFGSYGETDQSADATITLRSGTKSLIVRVKPTTGETSVD